ncbi:GPW/gp25 family protein [Desulfofundulus sp. TPOSR]|uniref:GPW/gp25 family protein n=1 Tax=Desulfofundulus sp. TPOSR TaxID=2714340 RepID=UPI00140D992C|nr:GPW/gp25 family protein [Desulfofundulus sp. TPOSR]NHM25469.1 GPW/gp25 family protein [Desulfofundulus sp. TPOSR]NHM27057.1 GPW/gp25 family protein [Desulfofundulus sp. TPOSR]
MEDILLDAQGNFVVAADGDVETVSGLECLLQDVKHLLLTFPGDLWAHPEYGVGLQVFIQAEDNELNRLELEQLIKDRLGMDDRIEAESVRVNIKNWDLRRITLELAFRPSPVFFEEEEEEPQEGEAVVLLQISQEGIAFGGTP